jgi:hypothetical protein
MPSGRPALELVQRREGRELVRSVPAPLRAPLLVRSDEVELTRAIGAGLTEQPTIDSWRPRSVVHQNVAWTFQGRCTLPK